MYFEVNCLILSLQYRKFFKLEVLRNNVQIYV